MGVPGKAVYSVLVTCALMSDQLTVGYLGNPASYREWSEILQRNFDSLRMRAMYRQETVMDPYGATNPAEFFAVATETFYEKPYQMAEHHGELFAEFLKYYRVDPRQWMTPPPPPPPVQLEPGEISYSFNLH